MLLQIVPLFFLFKVIDGNWTNLLTFAYLYSRLFKAILPQSFFVISIVFLIASKAFSNLDNDEDI
jgi:hypothetical protein